MTIASEVRAMVEREGFDLHRSTGRHLVYRHRASGRVLCVSKTPSDRRALQNIRRDMRRVLGEGR